MAAGCQRAVNIVLVTPYGATIRFKVPECISWSMFQKGVQRRLQSIAPHDEEVGENFNFYIAENDGARVQIVSTDDLCDSDHVIVVPSLKTNKNSNKNKKVNEVQSNNSAAPLSSNAEHLSCSTSSRQRKRNTVQERTFGEQQMREFLSIGYSAASHQLSPHMNDKSTLIVGPASIANGGSSGGGSITHKRAWDASSNTKVVRPSVIMRPWQQITNCNVDSSNHLSTSNDARLPQRMKGAESSISSIFSPPPISSPIKHKSGLPTHVKSTIKTTHSKIRPSSAVDAPPSYVASKLPPTNTSRHTQIPSKPATSHTSIVRPSTSQTSTNEGIWRKEKEKTFHSTNVQRYCFSTPSSGSGDDGNRCAITRDSGYAISIRPEQFHAQLDHADIKQKIGYYTTELHGEEKSYSSNKGRAGMLESKHIPRFMNDEFDNVNFSSEDLDDPDDDDDYELGKYTNIKPSKYAQYRQCPMTHSKAIWNGGKTMLGSTLKSSELDTLQATFLSLQGNGGDGAGGGGGGLTKLAQSNLNIESKDINSSVIWKPIKTAGFGVFPTSPLEGRFGTTQQYRQSLKPKKRGSPLRTEKEYRAANTLTVFKS